MDTTSSILSRSELSSASAELSTPNSSRNLNPLRRKASLAKCISSNDRNVSKQDFELKQLSKSTLLSRRRSSQKLTIQPIMKSLTPIVEKEKQRLKEEEQTKKNRSTEAEQQNRNTRRQSVHDSLMQAKELQLRDSEEKLAKAAEVRKWNQGGGAKLVEASKMWITILTWAKIIKGKGVFPTQIVSERPFITKSKMAVNRPVRSWVRAFFFFLDFFFRLDFVRGRLAFISGSPPLGGVGGGACVPPRIWRTQAPLHSSPA